MARKFISVKEAVAKLDVTDTTLRRWVKLGYIKAYRAGKRGNIRFDEDEMIRALDRADDRRGQGIERNDPSHS